MSHTRIFKVLGNLILLVFFCTGQAGAASLSANRPDKNNPANNNSALLAAKCLNAEGLRQQKDPHNNQLNFVGAASGKPIKHPDKNSASASPEKAARGYLKQCGSLFGVQDESTELKTGRVKELDHGRSVIKFQQVYQDIPIFASEIVMQMDKSKNIILINGDILPVAGVNTQAIVDAGTAQQTALQLTAEKYEYSSTDLKVSEPQLWIYNPMPILHKAGPTALVWRMEVTSLKLAPIREMILIDAQSGSIVLSFNQVDSVKNRLTYNMAGSHTTGFLVCNESNPTCSGGDTHAVNAHVYAGDTYDFYYNYHGRDSIDGAGMTLKSFVHFSTGYCNAFWDGYEMVYGDGCFLVVDDVVAHEMTHGVTENESGLIYSYESGAINESFSDIWGEFIDLTNGKGTDITTVRWLIGEDASVGAARNMKTPSTYNQPDRMGSPLYYTGSADNGGVHTNSGVGNKAAYLITDGDTFNGYAVTGLGITKAAKIYYEAQTNILTSSANYGDLANALLQACNNLIGTNSITNSDCTEVHKATLATEMTSVPLLMQISGNAAVAGTALSYTDGAAKTATADGSGNYSFTVPYGWSGTVTPSLTGYAFTPASKSYTNLASDLTGENYVATETTPPTVISALRANANPTNAASVDYTVTFSESVTGVDASDFYFPLTTVSGASVTNVSGSGTTYTVTVNTGSGSSTLYLAIGDDDTIIDTAGNPLGGVGINNGKYLGQKYTIDKAFPTVSSLVRASANPTSAATVQYTLTFSEPVTGVDASDFAVVPTGVAGSSVASVSGAGTTYTVIVNTGSGSGTLGLNLSDNNSIKDVVGNPLGGAAANDGDYTGEVYDVNVVDATFPTVVSSLRTDVNFTNATSVDFTVTFSKSVTGVDAADFSLATNVIGASVTNVSGSGTAYTVTVNTGSGNGTLRLVVQDNDTIIDGAGNPLGGVGLNNGKYALGQYYTIYKTTPSVVSLARASADPTNAATVQYTLTFSEPVKGVNAPDFSFTLTGGTTGASVASISGSGKTYTITINTGTGNGTLRLDVVDNDSITSLSGIPLGGVGDNGLYTGGEVYAISKP